MVWATYKAGVVNNYGPNAVLKPSARLLRLATATVAALLAACATPTEPPAAGLTVRHYPPPDIIVATSNTGRFETSGGCIYFRYERHPDQRRPALFARGTSLSPDRRAIILPGGEAISFGRRVTITYEAPPNATGFDLTCGANPILVLNLAKAAR